MNVYAVTGNPILQSQSPAMHQAAFVAKDIDACYLRIAATSAEDALNTCLELGIKGLNVTAPFKEEMAVLVDELEPTAEELASVNTVVFKNGKTKGYMTDVFGVQKAFRTSGVSLCNEDVLVLGAGGASKAAIYALKANGALVTLANRNKVRAFKVASAFEIPWVALRRPELANIFNHCRIIVSCISTTDRIIPAGLVSKDHIVFDAYYAEDTVLVSDAKECGARCISGHKWLLYQGAQAFEYFCNTTAPLSVMEQALQDQERHSAKKIALIGFMGSGKTSVAKGLAQALDYQHIDLDSEIEKEAGMKISEIFTSQGEEIFRKLEAAKLAKLSSMSHCVISCGGGIVLNENNRELLKRHFLNVWLWANPSITKARLEKDTSRPLLDTADKDEEIDKLLKQRLALYAESSDLVLNTSCLEPDKVIKRLVSELGVL